MSISIFDFCAKYTQDATEIKRDTKRMFLLDENWKLQIRRADISDTARYSCKATNIAGTAEKYFDLNVLGKLNQGTPWLNSNESKCYYRSQIYFKSGYIRYKNLF